ncbi:MAG: YbjN domain-containing protein [Solirubrobacteraceae bacterium]
MGDAAMSGLRELVDRYLGALEGDTRRVATDEWGLSVEAAGWPLHVGVALRDGLLRAQAEVLGPDRLDPEALLRWNRGLPLVRFSHTGAGGVYVEGALPGEAVTEARLDAFLGLLVRVATQAREAAAAGG